MLHPKRALRRAVEQLTHVPQLGPPILAKTYQVLPVGREGELDEAPVANDPATVGKRVGVGGAVAEHVHGRGPGLRRSAIRGAIRCDFHGRRNVERRAVRGGVHNYNHVRPRLQWRERIEHRRIGKRHIRCGERPVDGDWPGIDLGSRIGAGSIGWTATIYRRRS